MNYILTITTIILTFLTACQSQNNKSAAIEKAKDSTQTNSPFVSTHSNQFYFPLKVFIDSAFCIGLDTFENTWYSQHLFAMGEPILHTDKSDKEIYRFIWLRSFHNPVAIRIEKHGETYMLYWKLCDGAGGYDPGQLKVNKQKPIDKATYEEFKKCLNQIDFWNMSTNEKEIVGTDGSQWVLEGKTKNNYHIVDRWTPRENSKYYQCCSLLIELTDLIIKSEDKY